MMLLSHVKTMAEELLFRYELDDWTFGFNDRKRSVGLCYQFKKRIEVSLNLCKNGSEKTIRDTILHEIAHALVGPGHKHDGVWQAKAMELGIEPKACTNEVPDRGEGAKYIAHCRCGEPHYLYRKPKHLIGMYCIKIGREKGSLAFQRIKSSHRS